MLIDTTHGHKDQINNHVYIMINNLDVCTDKRKITAVSLLSSSIFIEKNKAALVSFLFLFQLPLNVSPTILTVSFLYAVYLWKIVRRLHIKCL